MGVIDSSIGRKAAMAASGALLLLFLVVHALGNSTIFAGWLNTYAEHLHSFPAAVWISRLVLLALFAVHTWYGVTLTLENRAAKPHGYAVAAHRRSTLASRTMIWTGLAIAGFLVYHQLHVTFQVIHPEAAALANRDAAGRPDVMRMILVGLKHAGTAAVYLLGMVALGTHLFHGVASSVQTFGLNGERSFPRIVVAGRVFAGLLALSFIGISAGILAGFIG
ncbi:MAG: succinate dehydrogenase cytochrome b subunit [Acidobacteria bacterium]|nr:succinate dehydrogenase cytochrome b subunit [Acidobacteriota bacterium]